MNGQPKPGFYFVVLLVILAWSATGMYRLKTPSGSDSARRSRSMPGDETAISQRRSDAARHRRWRRSAGCRRHHHGQGIRLRPQPEAAGGQGRVQLQGAGGPHGALRAQRLGRLGADHLRQRRLQRRARCGPRPGGKPFKVELVLIDDPVAMRDAYAAGDVHIGWATLDMLPLFLESCSKDTPRHAAHLPAGRLVATAATASSCAATSRPRPICAARPSCWRRTPRRTSSLLNTLINAGVQPAEVDFKFTEDAFQAAAAFNADKNVAGCRRPGRRTSTTCPRSRATSCWSPPRPPTS